MNAEELKKAKEKMKEYTDFFGSELRDKNLIDDAKDIIDLETIINNHHDYIADMANTSSKFRAI